MINIKIFFVGTLFFNVNSCMVKKPSFRNKDVFCGNLPCSDVMINKINYEFNNPVIFVTYNRQNNVVCLFAENGMDYFNSDKCLNFRKNMKANYVTTEKCSISRLPTRLNEIDLEIEEPYVCLYVFKDGKIRFGLRNFSMEDYGSRSQ